MQLPGTGELWARVGQTALQVGDRLQNSPLLNPAVRAQMKESMDRAKLGQQTIAYYATHPKARRALVGEGAQGATITPWATLPVTQAANVPADGDGEQAEEKAQEPTKPAPTKPAPTVTRTGKNTGVDENGDPYYETTPGSNQWTPGKVPPHVEMAAGGLVRAYADGGPVSPVWSPGRPTPEAPPAPSRPQEEQPAQAESAQQPTTPSPQEIQGEQPLHPEVAKLAVVHRQIEQQQQEALRQQQVQAWQAQNAHPVAPAGQALEWAKMYHTGYKTATYLPHAGPNGEPAYNFSDGKSLNNVVPLSQMVKNGFAPSVVSSSISPVLSAVDQVQRNQGPQGPGLPFGPVAPAQQAGQQPPPQVAQQPGGAPAAPGGQVWNPQQPAPMQPPAAPGQTQSVQQPAYMTTTGQSPMTPGPTGQQEPIPGWGAPLLGDKESGNADPSKATVDQINADTNFKIFPWKTETQGDFKGKKYLELPDDYAHPFTRRRFWQGSTGFVGGQGSPEDLRKQQILEATGGPGGVPIKDDKGNPTVLDYDTIKNSTPAQQNQWLAQIKDFMLHAKFPDPTSDEGKGLANAANAVMDAQRIKDKILYMKQNKIPMDAISQDEFQRSKDAGYAAAAHSPAEQAMWNYWAKFTGKNNFADELLNDYQNLNSHLNNIPGGRYQGQAATPPPQLWHWEFDVPGTAMKPQFDIPRTTNVSTIEQLNKIGSGDSYDQALGHIQEILDSATEDYRRNAAHLPKGGYRLPADDEKNIADLTNPQKGYIADKTNKMWDEKHEKMVNGYGQIPQPPWWFGGRAFEKGYFPEAPARGYYPEASASPSASPTPVSREVADAAPRPKTQAEYDAIKSTTLYWDRDGKLKPKP